MHELITQNDVSHVQKSHEIIFEQLKCAVTLALHVTPIS